MTGTKKGSGGDDGKDAKRPEKLTTAQKKQIVR